MAHELTVQELEKFSAEFNKKPENKVVARAAQRSGVLEASYNDRVQGQLTRGFSTELDTNNVTNQKHSGRLLVVRNFERFYVMLLVKNTRLKISLSHKLTTFSGTRLNVPTCSTTES